MDGNSTVRKISFLPIIWALLVALLIMCIVFPLICVFITPRFSDFKTIFTSALFTKTIKNTFIECLCSTCMSVLVGFLYAYAVVKVKVPFSKFFSVIPLIHLVTPPFVGGLSFILLLGRNGLITNKIFGLDVSLYGFWGLLIAQTLCFFPIAYMMLSQTLQNINPALEDAAKSIGAGKLKIFFTVILPLSLPGILAALLFIAVSVLSDFGNPMIVGGRFRVLAVEIYTQLTGWINGSISAALGVLLVIPSFILFILQNKLLVRNLKKTATISGKGSILQTKNKFTFSTLFFTCFCIFITVCIIAQFVAIVAGSLQKVWLVDTSFTWDHLKYILKCKSHLLNSVSFSILAAILSTLCASFIAFIVYRTNLHGKKLLDLTVQVPSAVPGSLFGLAFSLAAAKLNFTNSKLLIIIAITVGFIPFSYKTLCASFSQIRMTLDESSNSLGASKIKTLFSVIIPVSKNAIFNSFIYCFVRGVGTMSAVIFLISFDTPLTSVKILNLAEQGFWSDAAALALILTLICFVMIAVGKLLISRWGKKR